MLRYQDLYPLPNKNLSYKYDEVTWTTSYGSAICPPLALRYVELDLSGKHVPKGFPWRNQVSWHVDYLKIRNMVFLFETWYLCIGWLQVLFIHIDWWHQFVNFSCVLNYSILWYIYFLYKFHWKLWSYQDSC